MPGNHSVRDRHRRGDLVRAARPLPCRRRHVPRHGQQLRPVGRQRRGRGERAGHRPLDAQPWRPRPDGGRDQGRCAFDQVARRPGVRELGGPVGQGRTGGRRGQPEAAGGRPDRPLLRALGRPGSGPGGNRRDIRPTRQGRGCLRHRMQQHAGLADRARPDPGPRRRAPAVLLRAAAAHLPLAAPGSGRRERGHAGAGRLRPDRAGLRGAGLQTAAARRLHPGRSAAVRAGLRAPEQPRPTRRPERPGEGVGCHREPGRPRLG